MAKPPKDTLSVRMTNDLREDLEVVLRTGMSISDATKAALHLAACICAVAWENGDVPEGVIPWVSHVEFVPYDETVDRLHPGDDASAA